MIRFRIITRIAAAIGFITLTTVHSSHAQSSLINSEELLKSGVEAYDKGDYKSAVRSLSAIPNGDSNYVTALHELIISYMADSSFRKAKELSQEGLRLPNGIKKRDFLLNLADVCDYLNETDTAELIYDQLIKMNPYDYQPWYEKGICRYNAKKYDEANSCFEHALMLQPFHTRSHYFLGLSYFKQGRLTESYLAMSGALLCTNDQKISQKLITMLDLIAQQAKDVTEAYQQKKPAYANEVYDETDELMTGKVALSVSYKYKSEFCGDKIANTLHMLLEKMHYRSSDTTFSMQYYVPLFTGIDRDEDFDGLLCYMVAGAGTKEIDKILKANKRGIERVQTYTVAYFKKIAATQELNYAKRKNAERRFGVFPKDGLFAVGHIISEDPMQIAPGEIVLYKDGYKFAEGQYEADNKKTGAWKYYYSNGNLNREENYLHDKLEGPAVSYYINGNKRFEKIFKNDEPVKETFYTYSGYKESENTADGRNKRYTSFYTNGAMEMSYGLVDDKLTDGMVKTYYKNGNLMREVSYKDGVRNGPFAEYFRDGKTYRKGTLNNDEPDGAYTEYNDIGQMTERSTFRKGKYDGLYTSYDVHGTINEEGNYDDGNRTGLWKVYNSRGRQYGALTYSHNAPVKYSYTDTTGKVIAADDKGGKNGVVKYYNEYGNLASERPYRDGQLEGTARYYDEAGKLISTINYANGARNGIVTEYYPLGGKKKSELNWSKDRESGIYNLYYPDGTLKTSGGYFSGKKEGDWRYYTSEGRMFSRDFYVNGENNGPDSSFYPNGKPECVIFYDYNVRVRYIQFDTAGRVIHHADFPGGNGTYEYYGLAGKATSSFMMKGGKFNGKFTRSLPSGQLLAQGYYDADVQDSTYKEWHRNGQLSREGAYISGSEEGTWKTWDEQGKLLTECTYHNGKKEGIERIYLAGTLRIENNYFNDVRDGLKTYYAGPGVIALQLKFEQGTLTGYTYPDKDGKMLPFTPVEKGTAHITSWYADGTKAAEVNYSSNEPEGRQAVYYKTGKPEAEENIVNGLNEGPFKRWYANGNLYYDANYKSDHLHGSEKTYTEKGALICDMQFEYGLLNGVSVLYDLTTGKTKKLTYYNNMIIRED